MALDRLWYVSSENIHCEHCLTKTVKDKEGNEETRYYHAAVAGAIVKPGCTKVLPVAPEIISNSDGTAKQDCELNAGKRWLYAHGDEYTWLKPTILGDDLYAKRPFCEKIIEQGMGFILSCREDSHPWLYETLRNSYLYEVKETKWDTQEEAYTVHLEISQQCTNTV